MNHAIHAGKTCSPFSLLSLGSPSLYISNKQKNTPQNKKLHSTPTYRKQATNGYAFVNKIMFKNTHSETRMTATVLKQDPITLYVVWILKPKRILTSFCRHRHIAPGRTCGKCRFLVTLKNNCARSCGQPLRVSAPVSLKNITTHTHHICQNLHPTIHPITKFTSL